MKLVRFERADGSIGWGVAVEFGIQDICKADPTLPSSLSEVIAKWDSLAARIVGLSKKLGVSDESLRILCPLDTPKKILCIGLNYRDHAIETNAPIPTEPVVFCKMPTAMIGPDDLIELPSVSNEVDYESELVIVIGKKVKNADSKEAAASIFGYSAGHDVSARDWQKGKPGKQWFLGKSFDTFAPLGPVIVTADSIVDIRQLRVQGRLNGEIVQDSTTAELIFSPTEIVQYISQVMTLEPGDVIYTGTPSGVGVARNPPVFLKDGDIFEVEIQSIGILANRCVQR